MFVERPSDKYPSRLYENWQRRTGSGNRDEHGSLRCWLSEKDICYPKDHRLTSLGGDNVIIEAFFDISKIGVRWLLLAHHSILILDPNGLRRSSVKVRIFKVGVVSRDLCRSWHHFNPAMHTDHHPNRDNGTYKRRPWT